MKELNTVEEETFKIINSNQKDYSVVRKKEVDKNLPSEELIVYKKIEDLIVVVRGKQVLLDSDVARLYEYEIRTINQTVKRNINRFPEEFCFQLTEEEYNQLKLMMDYPEENTDKSLRSQIVTLKNESGTGKHRKYLPYVFTEQGIAMLSGLLKNDIAVEVSIKIMKSFVEMRKFISANKDLFKRDTALENTILTKLLEHDQKFDEVFDYMHKNEEFKQRIFFAGQIYDAYDLISKIIKQAKEEIKIIDNYVDDTVLALLSKKAAKVNVLIITSNNSKLSKLDISKFNEQYPRLKVEYSGEHHDRFIIIDKTTIYHCGASLKDLGKKTFAITKMENTASLKKMNAVIEKPVVV